MYRLMKKISVENDEQHLIYALLILFSVFFSHVYIDVRKNGNRGIIRDILKVQRISVSLRVNWKTGTEIFLKSRF